LGFIEVVNLGTPVSIMSIVDPNDYSHPHQPNTYAEVGNHGWAYTVRCCQIRFQAVKPGTHGLGDNTGNIYIVRKDGSRDDPGTIVAMVEKGDVYETPSGMAQGNCLNPYRYFIDADNVGDGAIVTLFISTN